MDEVCEKLLNSHSKATKIDDKSTMIDMSKVKYSIQSLLSTQFCPITLKSFSVENEASEADNNDKVSMENIALVVEHPHNAFLFDKCALLTMISEHYNTTNPMTRENIGCFCTINDQYHVSTGGFVISSKRIIEDIVRFYDPIWREIAIPNELLQLRVKISTRIVELTLKELIEFVKANDLTADMILFYINVFGRDLMESFNFTTNNFFHLLSDADFLKFLNDRANKNQKTRVWNVLFSHNSEQFVQCFKQRNESVFLQFLRESKDVLFTLHSHAPNALMDLLVMISPIYLCEVLSRRNTLGNTFGHILTHECRIGQLMFQSNDCCTLKVPFHIVTSIMKLENKQMESVFHWLVKFSPDTAFTILRNDPSPHKLGLLTLQDGKKNSILHWAGYFSPNILESFLNLTDFREIMVLMSQRDSGGCSVFHMLAEQKPSLLTGLLTAHSFDFDVMKAMKIPDHEGNTVSHWFAYHNPFEFINFLRRMPPKEVLAIQQLINNKGESVMSVSIVPRRKATTETCNAIAAQIMQIQLEAVTKIQGLSSRKL